MTISSTLLLCFSLSIAASQSIEDIKKSILSCISIEFDEVGNPFLDEITKSEFVDAYNFRSSGMARYYNYDGEPLETVSEGAYGQVEVYEGCGIVRSNSASSLDMYFSEASMVLCEGRHIETADSHAILMHQKFAEANGLSVGDSLMIGDALDKESQIQVKLIGIYTNISAQTELLMEHELKYNMSFVDQMTFGQMYSRTSEPPRSHLDLFLYNPDDINEVLFSAEQEENEDWIIRVDNALYLETISPLKSSKTLVISATIIIVGMCVSILILTLVINIRSRMREIGILLSMGMSKFDVVLQHVFESVSKHIISLLPACLMWGMCFKIVASCLEINSTVILNWMSVVKIFMLTFTLSTIIILFSVLIASIPLIRLRPRSILIL